ncbi:MAG: 16S rRNA (cytosine(967)-C(5))-methyltransferase RsmB, partial [Acetobacteraceae bacterium]|nr:16S rRNA (cytosine(967)-C(5))-methyltransferase RsmB [Acetobacteraceae bacterium]
MKRSIKIAVADRQGPASAALRPHATEGLAARRTALQILLYVERDHAFADVLLGRRLHGFAAADRRLITQLVLGTIAWQGRLDFELSRHSARPLGELAPEVLTALRMGLFQVRILSRIPQHAAVDTAVSLTRELAGGRRAGFVNAVLRNAIRSPVALPPRAAGETEYLAIAYSHPRWLVEKLIAWLGLPAAESLMAANNQPAPNVLRLNLARGTVEDLVALLARDGMTIARRGRFPETVILDSAPVLDGETWRAGFFQLQAEASQLVTRLLAPCAPAFVIDCAAAPGGKATHLAQLIGPGGKVLALDLKFSGLISTRSAAARLGHRNVLIARADTSLPLPVRPRSAGFVLLDAPCTGLGTLREHPEIRWRLSELDIERMAILQRRMLEQAAAAVAAGGVLVYAVCSIAPDEGPDIIAAFLAENPDFELDRTPPAARQLKGILDREGCLRTRPD